MEEWTEVEDFPGYSVSNLGSVLSTTHARSIRFDQNQSGIIHVSLYRGGKQYRRSVARLVADAFLEPHPLAHYDSIIHLDGDKSNNESQNLMWRPRWFAIRFHQQFHDSAIESWRTTPIETLETGIVESLIDVCSRYGLLVRDVMHAAHNWTYCPNTKLTFRVYYG